MYGPSSREILDSTANASIQPDRAHELRRLIGRLTASDLTLAEAKQLRYRIACLLAADSGESDLGVSPIPVGEVPAAA